MQRVASYDRSRRPLRLDSVVRGKELALRKPRKPWYSPGQPAPRIKPDLSLYLVTNSVSECGHHDWPDMVESAIRGGVTIVQLRHKALPDAEFVQIGSRLRDVTAAHNVLLLVNDRVHLAADCGADGAHIGQGDLPAARAREILGAGAILGVTVKTPGQACSVDPTVVDYVGCGPVFAQSTKRDAGDEIGLDGLTARVTQSPVPVVAIGGITVRNAAKVYPCGVAGVAVASSICQASDPYQAATQIKASRLV